MKTTVLDARSYWLASFATMAMVLGGCSAARPPISVSVSPSSVTAIDQGLTVNITATVMNDRVPGRGVTWSLIGPGSLADESTQSVIYVSPAKNISSSEHATVTAVSVGDPRKTASVEITVNPYPSLPFQGLADGTVGVSYSQPVALNGGTAPFQWNVYNGAISSGWKVGGSVPDGLTFDANTGVVSGTPTAAGTWYFELSVTDSDNKTATASVSIQVDPATTAKGNTVPFLNQLLTPDSAAPGGSDLTLNVSGTGFVSGGTVDFDGTPLVTSFEDSEHLSATVPAADLTAAKTASVTVVNPPPGGGSSNVVYFAVGAPEATVSFVDAPNSPIQVNEPFGLAAADFNQDGTPDLAITANVKLYTMLGKGDGTFTSAPDSPMPVPSPPYFDLPSPELGPMAVGDFNHSGHPGLAAVEISNGAAVILGGNGDGTFSISSAAFANAEGWPTDAVEAADFNADGNLDLALINQLTQAYGVPIVTLGFGTGAFSTSSRLYYPVFPIGAAVGDFNDDGKLDVAIAGSGSMKYPDSGVLSLGISIMMASWTLR